MTINLTDSFDSTTLVTAEIAVENVVDSPIFGTNGDDVLKVFYRVPEFDPSAEYYGIRIFGYAGNDQIFGAYGDDLLYGGDGNDTFFGNYGNDTIDGGAGIDTVDYATGIHSGQWPDRGGGWGWSYGNLYHAGFGVEVNLEFGYGRTLDPSSAEQDILISIENVNGSSYGDVLQGNEAANVLNGQSGDDWLFGWGGSDTLIGEYGTDRMSGGDGDDRLQGGFGDDYMIGNAGFDTVDYSYSITGQYVSLAAGSAHAAGDATLDVDTLVEIEGVIGSLANDTIYGRDGFDTLHGNAGNDTLIDLAGDDLLFGDAGDDSISSGAGADRIDGGEGWDRVIYKEAGSGIIIGLGGSPGIGSDAAGDVLFNVEEIIGSDYNDFLWGNALDNRLWGRDGNDRLEGSGGSDVLQGGFGADILRGDAGFDTAVYINSLSGVTVNLATGIGSGGEAQGDTLDGIEGLQGSEFADTLTAGAAAVFFTGMGGNDRLNGGDFADFLSGGFGNDTLMGRGGADSMSGDAGTDSLNGGLGNDALAGGLGADNLTGGSGGDVFRYDSGADSTAATRDRITDFLQGEDIIDLLAVDAIISLLPGDNTFSFIGNAAFSGAAGELRFQIQNGNTLIQGETNGWAGADFEILLTGNIQLNAADFVL